MKTTVKILSENRGISLVRETSGARREDDLFIALPLGESGDIIEVPEFWIQDSNSEAAKKFFS